jgi:hypothetical protein
MLSETYEIFINIEKIKPKILNFLKLNKVYLIEYINNKKLFLKYPKN